MGLSKHRRLRRREEFRRVLRDGNRARDALISITAADTGSPDSEPRYGFAIPKRVGGAVTRNRIKRRLRTIVNQTDHPKGWGLRHICLPGSVGCNVRTIGAIGGNIGEALKVWRPHSPRRETRSSFEVNA